MDEYITVKYKIATIKRQRKLRLFVLLPVYIIVLAVFYEYVLVTIMCIAGIGYTIWCQLHWNKLLKENSNVHNS